MVKLVLWEGDFDVATFEFESAECAIDFVKSMSANSIDGWSVVDENGFWIIEEGEKMIPLQSITR